MAVRQPHFQLVLLYFTTVAGLLLTSDAVGNPDGGQDTTLSCPVYHFKCLKADLSSYWCIDSELLCNGRPHCADGADEEEEMCRTRECPYAQMFRCDSGQCLYRDDICTGRRSSPQRESPNCADGSDLGAVQCLGGCPGYWANHVADMFQCATGECVYNVSRCDGAADCGDGSDESPRLCAPGDAATATDTGGVSASGSATLGLVVGTGIAGAAFILVIVIITIICFFCCRRYNMCRCCVKSSHKPSSGVQYPAGGVDTVPATAARPPMPTPGMNGDATPESGYYQSVIYTRDGYVQPENTGGTAGPPHDSDSYLMAGGHYTGSRNEYAHMNGGGSAHTAATHPRSHGDSSDQHNANGYLSMQVGRLPSVGEDSSALDVEA